MISPKITYTQPTLKELSSHIYIFMRIYVTINSKRGCQFEREWQGWGDNIKWRDISGCGREKVGNGGKTVNELHNLFLRQKLKLALIQRVFHKALFVINVNIHHTQNLSSITHILNDQCQIIFKRFTVLVLEHIM